MSSKKLNILQVNDSHAYLELHNEYFWGPGAGEYRPAGGYARLGVPSKYGSRRQVTSIHAVEAMQSYLKRHSPYRGGLRDTFVLV